VWEKYTRQELINLIEVQEKLINERDRVLDLLPCPKHGKCVPFAIEEIERLKNVEHKYDVSKKTKHSWIVGRQNEST